FTIDGQPRVPQGRPCRWANADARLWEIPLTAPLARDKRVEIAFRYAGKPDWPLDGRITPQLSWMLPQAAWFPRLGTGRVGEDDWSEIDMTVTAPRGQVVVANGTPDAPAARLSALGSRLSAGEGPGPAESREPRAESGSATTPHHWHSALPGSPFFV